jgi:5-hydroxyisourate hydrolase
VPVRLEKQDSTGAWRLLTLACTDEDGRCLQLLPEGEDFCAGVYRLIFDSASYFVSQKIPALYPIVIVAFQVQEGESHFHLPLLLSPNGYTTYRGS